MQNLVVTTNTNQGITFGLDYVESYKNFSLSINGTKIWLTLNDIIVLTKSSDLLCPVMFQLQKQDIQCFKLQPQLLGFLVNGLGQFGLDLNNALVFNEWLKLRLQKIFLEHGSEDVPSEVTSEEEVVPQNQNQQENTQIQNTPIQNTQNTGVETQTQQIQQPQTNGGTQEIAPWENNTVDTSITQTLQPPVETTEQLMEQTVNQINNSQVQQGVQS